MHKKLFFAWLIAAGSLAVQAAAQVPRVLHVELPGQNLFGMPVHWDPSTAALLEADGRFHLIETERVRRTAILDDEFRPESLTAARGKLQAELGEEYETLIAGPYVIAAPAGQSKRWKSRFTSLLSGYTRYFDVRGWPLRKPDFPLVVIVFRTRPEFVQYVTRESARLIPQAVGGYFPESNRCMLYQIPGLQGTDWSETEATIVHEAVHQIAYNTGVHERLFENPLWYVEGLATMFEVPSVYDLGARNSDIVSRMNSSQLVHLQSISRETAVLESRISSLIESDQLFRADAAMAYAVSWGLTFYLSERMPTEYREYMRLQRQRPFGIYEKHRRLQDFHQAFRIEPAMLALQMNRLFSN